MPPWYGERMKALGEHRAARIGLAGPDRPGPARRPRPRAHGARPTADDQGGRQARLRAHDQLDRSARARRRPGPQLVYPDLEPAEAIERLTRQLEHVLRLDEDDPLAAWRERADMLVGVAQRLTERRFDAIRYQGPGTDLTVGLLPSGSLAGGALHDDRRHRAHAEPADRGGLHHAGPAAGRRARDLHQAARPAGRDGGRGPARPLRGRPRGRRGSRPGRRDDAYDARARRGRQRGSARSPSSTARAASARSRRPSTTRCSTRTRPATSRSARASRSSSAPSDRRASTRARSTSTS